MGLCVKGGERLGRGMCILCSFISGIGFLLDCVFCIAYCGRAGETATIQLFDWPAAFRLQTGLTLEALLGRMEGLTGRRDGRALHERMCEIGQEILGAARQTGGWRRPRAADGGVDRYERMYEGSLTFV